jgi:hypothetical protein
MPLHDPGCQVLPHLVEALPALLEIFQRVFLGVTLPACQGCPFEIETLLANERLHITWIDPHLPVGDQFLALYRWAAGDCPPESGLHLCFPDRVVFALQPGYRSMFAVDVAAAGPEDLPVLYQRSPAAWETHPRNYREMEGFLTRVGESLFGRSLDFAWCHLAVRAGRLVELLPHVYAHDMSILAELILLLKDEIRTREVDWLAWEDPFLLGADPLRLKAEREASPHEARKRLSYVIPMLQRLFEYP